MKRRELLGASSIVLGSAIAGCSTLTGQETGKDETYSFSDWLHADHEPRFGYTNFEKVELEEVNLRSLEDYFGINSEDVEELIAVPQFSEDSDEIILTGEFDTEDVLEHLEEHQNAESRESYGDYDIVDDPETMQMDTIRLEDHQLAIGTDAVVGTQDYESRIDARNGEAPRTQDEYEDFGHILSNMPEPDRFEEETAYTFSAGKDHSENKVNFGGESLLEIAPENDPGRYYTVLVFEDEEYVTEENVEETLSRSYESQSGVRLEEILEMNTEENVASLEWEYIPTA